MWGNCPKTLLDENNALRRHPQILFACKETAEAQCDAARSRCSICRYMMVPSAFLHRPRQAAKLELICFIFHQTRWRSGVNGRRWRTHLWRPPKIHVRIPLPTSLPSVNDTISHQAHCGTQRSVSEPRDPQSLQNSPEASEASTNCQALRVSDVSRDVLPPYLVRA